MNRIIRYAVSSDDGTIVSRVGEEFAWPILDWDAMQPSNNFAASYNLERVPVLSVGYEYRYLKFTRKIPIAIKNIHRAFWGMRVISEQPKLRHPKNSSGQGRKRKRKNCSNGTWSG